MAAGRPLAPMPQTKGHGPGLNPPHRDEWMGGASRQVASIGSHSPAGPLDQTPHQRQRRFGPGALGDLHLHHVRFGVSRALLSPAPPSNPACEMRLQKTSHRLSHQPHKNVQSTQVHPWRKTAWSPCLALSSARLDLRSARSSASRPALAKGAATWR